VLAAAAAGLALAGLRYASVIGDAESLGETARSLASDVRSMQIADLDRASLERLRAGLGELDVRLAPVRDLLNDDPLVGVARQLPGSAGQVESAEALVEAAESLVEAGHIALGLADRVVSLREANDADPDFALLPGLVELMAQSRGDVDRMAALLADADRDVARIPDEAIGQIREARDLVAGPVETYSTLLDSYRELDDVLPGLLGWGEEKRYLVLAQNPAELRPTGGYTGTVGVLVLRDGDMVEQRFVDTYELSTQEGLPFVDPPDDLTDHLLGEGQSWRLADANWSPDFPTVARHAMELYEIETGDAEVDGVIGITTYALDRLLDLVGAVDVPEYGVTVEPGDVTMTLLGATRGSPTSIQGRKDVLDALARQTMTRLLSLPPGRWADSLKALEEVGERRDALLWMADPEAQRLVEEAGWSGAVRQDLGDYLYVVESNVAPTSKYNLVVDRADSLVVKLGRDGNAVNSLRLDWQNHAGEDGEPYESLRSFSINQEGWYGSYVRVLTPAGSDVREARGRASSAIRGVEREAVEAGRPVFGNYLLMPPGASRLSYVWAVPGAAVQTPEGWVYELVVQKQPGARTVPLSIRVGLPEGAVVSDVSDGAVADGGEVRLEADLDSDVELRIAYALPEATAESASRGIRAAG
jgi:hypothetical protein